MSTPFASRAAVGAAEERTFLRGVFQWMLLAVLLSTAVAVYLDRTTDVVGYFEDHGGAMFALFGVQIGLVLALSAAIGRLSATAATALFAAYAFTVGVTFSVLLGVYTTSSMVGAFAGAAGLFGGMAAWGHATERDLSGWGTVLFGAVCGIFVASIANVFVGGDALSFVIGIAGVVVFSALTAYDIQKLKRMASAGFASDDDRHKATIIGALQLYLDFVNLVISLLRIFGARR